MIEKLNRMFDSTTCLIPFHLHSVKVHKSATSPQRQLHSSSHQSHHSKQYKHFTQMCTSCNQYLCYQCFLFFQLRDASNQITTSPIFSIISTMLTLTQNFRNLQGESIASIERTIYSFFITT